MSEHNNDPELETCGDQIVRFAEASQWFEELFKQPLAPLRHELSETEPALAAIATHMSDRLAQRLTQSGVSPSVTGMAADAAYQTGLVCSILACRAYREFLRDLYKQMEE